MRMEAKTFDELSNRELYNLMALRTDIFVVEQKCAYPELDHYDQGAVHVLGWLDDKIVCYARLLNPNTVYKEASIGRVATHTDYRKRGLGRELFRFALNKIKAVHPDKPIKLQAQIYLETFYAEYGFETISEPYRDVGIWHVDMLLKNRF